ncbi:MAG: T9SS type A sorting domain-containing protein, partial [Chitinophagales bacterium]
VSPVGELWRVLRTNHPEIDLYASDGSHPSAVGSYAAAVAFFTAIFRHDPTTITFNFNLDEQITTIIKEEAKALIYNQQAQWFIGTYDNPDNPCNLTNIPNEYSVETEQVFGFISVDQLIITNTDNILSVEVFDLTGKLVIRKENDLTNIFLPAGNGVYLVLFHNKDEKRIAQKIVK